MVNSVTLRFFINIYKKSEDFYEKSLTKKIIDKIKKPLNLAISNSTIIELLNREKSIFESSFIYKMYIGIFKLIERLMILIGKLLLPQIDKSLFLANTYKSLESFDEICGIISNIILYSGFFATIISIIARESIKISFAIFIFGLVASVFKGHYLEILKGSRILEFFVSFFELDKGGEEWW